VEFKTHSTSWRSSSFTANQEIPAFIENNYSLPCSLQPPNFPYPNPYQSNPCPPILYLNDPFQYYAPISVLVCIWSLSFRFPYQNLYAFLVSPITAIFPAHLILLHLVILIIRDTNHTSPKFECRPKTACSTAVRRYESRALCEPVCQAALCCGRVYFFCAFFWGNISAVLRSYQPAKMNYIKEQRILY
jgi:hypothetical protein